MADNDYSIIQKQHDIMRDTYSRLNGRSFSEALKDPIFRDRYMNNRQRSFYISMNDNPIAEMKLTQLDRERALIDLREYEALMNKTHEAVKKEAIMATEEGVEEALKELEKIFK